MAFAHSPKIVTDGMVFYYDTGNSKSYAGEPTTNLITHVLPNSSWVTNSAGTLITENYGLDPNGVLRSSKIVDNPNSGNGAFAYTSALNVSAGTYTFSAKVKTSSPAASANCYMVLYDMDPITNLGLTTFTNLTPGEWTNVAVTATLASGTTRIAPHFMTPTGNVNDFIEVVDVQLEQKSHATPFVDGTRLATESLRDFTKNVDLDVSDVSFDSNADITFDGTNDHISGVLPLQGGGAPHTIELVLSLDVNQGSVGSRRDPFTIGNATTHQYSALDINPGYMNWYFYGKDTTFTNNPTLAAGQYYHMVLAYQGGYSNNQNKRVWINGIEQSLSSGPNEVSLLPDNPQFSVGRDIGRTTAYFPGKIPIFKVYQRALVEEEVLQHFNTIKGRFGI